MNYEPKTITEMENLVDFFQLVAILTKYPDKIIDEDNTIIPFVSVAALEEALRQVDPNWRKNITEFESLLAFELIRCSSPNQMN